MTNKFYFFKDVKLFGILSSKGKSMKKLTLGIISVSALLTTACATVAPAPQARDQEPLLVGKPVAERVAESETSIDDQLQLLQKIQSGQKVGSYSVVQHNNNLDARRGSNNTVPKAYAFPPAKNTVTSTTVKEDSPKVMEANSTVSSVDIARVKLQKIKKIEWENNSLNKLSGDLAKAMGYTLVVKEGQVKDKTIDFTAENMTLADVITKLKNQNASFVDIIVYDENKTFNVLYK